MVSFQKTEWCNQSFKNWCFVLKKFIKYSYLNSVHNELKMSVWDFCFFRKANVWGKLLQKGFYKSYGLIDSNIFHMKMSKITKSLEELVSDGFVNLIKAKQWMSETFLGFLGYLLCSLTNRAMEMDIDFLKFIAPLISVMKFSTCQWKSKLFYWHFFRKKKNVFYAKNNDKSSNQSFQLKLGHMNDLRKPACSFILIFCAKGLCLD